MQIKINYADGSSYCVDSKLISSVSSSLAEYINSQFQFDEYSLKCDSTEINFGTHAASVSRLLLEEINNFKQLAAV
jgi:hypothetical protein